MIDTSERTDRRKSVESNSDRRNPTVGKQRKDKFIIATRSRCGFGFLCKRRKNSFRSFWVDYSILKRKTSRIKAGVFIDKFKEVLKPRLIFPSCFIISGEFLRTGITYKALISLGRDARTHYLKVRRRFWSFYILAVFFPRWQIIWDIAFQVQHLLVEEWGLLVG